MGLGGGLLFAGCGLPAGHDAEHDAAHDHDHAYDDLMLGQGRIEQGLTEAGRWMLSEALAATGEAQDVPYDGAPPYADGANCSGGSTPGARTLRDHLLGYFPQIASIGIYNCRVIAGTSSMSLHGVGRALDVMIPTIDGDADNGAGDPIAQFLIENAEALGLQMIIWDGSIWNAARSPRHYVYNGSNPHRDHLHIELNEAGAAEEMPWFDAPYGPTPCGVIPPETTILDDGDDCVSLFGPAQYWRMETGAGEQGDLRWTHAFDGAQASNWAQFALPLEVPGLYHVEVSVPGGFADFDRARYEVRANGETFAVTLDQSSLDGYVSLGEYFFGATGNEGVAIFDNAPPPVGENQRIVVDALRITPITLAVCDPLSSSGEVLDDDDPCFETFGPSQFWRYEAGVGFGDGLLWTNAFEGDNPSNFATWSLPVSRAAPYALAVYLDPAHAQFAATRYVLHQGDEETALLVDQSVADGWFDLGVFSLDPAVENRLSVYDHADAPVGDARRIVVDALRVLATDGPEVEDPADGSASTGDEGASALPCRGVYCGSRTELPRDPPALDVEGEVVGPEGPSAEPIAVSSCAQTHGNGLALLALVALCGLRRRRAV